MADRLTTDELLVVARLRQLVIDCRQPAPLARFWAAALDDFAIRPYDDAEIARPASSGRTPDTSESPTRSGVVP